MNNLNRGNINEPIAHYIISEKSLSSLVSLGILARQGCNKKDAEDKEGKMEPQITERDVEL